MNEAAHSPGSFSLPDIDLTDNYGKLTFNYKFFGGKTSRLLVNTCGTTFQLDGSGIADGWQDSEEIEVLCDVGGNVEVNISPGLWFSVKY